jgi:beta-N-acetylhexosaminidase
MARFSQEFFMDVREIGKLFVIGFQGTEFAQEARELLDDLNPSGVILFSRNIADPLQVAALNQDLQEHSLKRTGEGLLIGVDQEGGRVRRLKEPFTAFPPALISAAAPDPEHEVQKFARITAEEIRLVGFNLDFTPVLDVLGQKDDPENSVIGDRSYGSEPAMVSRLGLIVVETMRAAGVIPCGKHFPGHGGAGVDSHKTLPVDARSQEALDGCDLIPFRDAVTARVEMLMTAHVLYSALDPTLPATLSPQVIDGLLRTRMSYDGVVITDDLDMGAISNHYTPEESALKAFSAGVDLLLICNAPEKAFSARKRLFTAIQDKEISVARVKRSFERIARLKAQYVESTQPCDPRKVAEYFRGGAGTAVSTGSPSAPRT